MLATVKCGQKHGILPIIKINTSEDLYWLISTNKNENVCFIGSGMFNFKVFGALYFDGERNEWG